MRSLRVMVFSDMYPSPDNPGSGTFVHELTKAVSRQCKVVVVNPRLHFAGAGNSRRQESGPSPAAEVESHDVTVIRPSVYLPPFGDRLAFRSFLYAAFSFRTVLDLRRRFDPDLFHAHMICPSGFATLILGRLLRRPVVITAWGSDLHTYPLRFFLGCMTRYTLGRADTVVTVSNSLRDMALRLGASTKRVRVIHNGVDTQAFRPLDRLQAREDLGLPLDRLLVLFVGALIERKGVSFLLEAFSAISKEQSDTLLVIVGDGELGARLRASCIAGGLDDSVIFAGARPHAEMPRWMNAADMLCLPSLHEGLPTVVVEALACGVPVVASKVDGVPEAIDSESVGVLCRPADVQDLTRALRTATGRCRAATSTSIAGTGASGAVTTYGRPGSDQGWSRIAGGQESRDRRDQGGERLVPWNRSALVERGRAFSYEQLAGDYLDVYRDVVSRRPVPRIGSDPAPLGPAPVVPLATGA